jgi:hypothetical protein
MTTRPDLGNAITTRGVGGAGGWYAAGEVALTRGASAPPFPARIRSKVQHPPA